MPLFNVYKIDANNNVISTLNIEMELTELDEQLSNSVDDNKMQGAVIEYVVFCDDEFIGYWN